MPLRSWLTRSKIKPVISVGHLILFIYNEVFWERRILLNVAIFFDIYNKGGKSSAAVWLLELPHWREGEEIPIYVIKLAFLILTFKAYHRSTCYLCFVS